MGLDRQIGDLPVGQISGWILLADQNDRLTGLFVGRFQRTKIASRSARYGLKAHRLRQDVARSNRAQLLQVQNRNRAIADVDNLHLL